MMMIDERLDGFRTHLCGEEKSPLTVRKYLHDAAEFCRFLKGRALTKELVISFKNNLRERYAVSSCNSMLAATNQFLKYIGRDDLTVRRFKVQRSAFLQESKELSREDYRHMMTNLQRNRNCPKDRRKALLMETIAGTGIRVSELRFVTVEAARDGGVTVSLKGKTRKIFLVKKLCRKLLDYAEGQGISSGPIFLDRHGKVLDRSTVWRELKDAARKSGVALSKVFPHNLRHLFARCFYELEKDIVKLADILGHSSIETTRIYVASTGAEHRRKMERVELVT